MLYEVITLILGERDRLTPARSAQRLAATLSNAETVILKGCGHAMLAEQPDPVLDHRITSYNVCYTKLLRLGYYRVTRTELNGVPLTLSRTGWSGELGYEIYLHDRTHGEWLWETIMQAGAESGIAPAAPNTIRSRNNFV